MGFLYRSIKKAYDLQLESLFINSIFITTGNYYYKACSTISISFCSLCLVYKKLFRNIWFSNSKLTFANRGVWTQVCSATDIFYNIITWVENTDRMVNNVYIFSFEGYYLFKLDSCVGQNEQHQVI